MLVIILRKEGIRAFPVTWHTGNLTGHLTGYLTYGNLLTGYLTGYLTYGNTWLVAETEIFYLLTWLYGYFSFKTLRGGEWYTET